MMRNGSNISYACYGKALRKENQKELDSERYKCGDKTVDTTLDGKRKLVGNIPCINQPRNC